MKTVIIFIVLKIAEFFGLISILGIFWLVGGFFEPEGVFLERVFYGFAKPFIVISIIGLSCLAIYHIIKKNIEWAKSLSKK